MQPPARRHRTIGTFFSEHVLDDNVNRSVHNFNIIIVLIMKHIALIIYSANFPMAARVCKLGLMTRYFLWVWVRVNINVVELRK